MKLSQYLIYKGWFFQPLCSWCHEAAVLRWRLPPWCNAWKALDGGQGRVFSYCLAVFLPNFPIVFPHFSHILFSPRFRSQKRAPRSHRWPNGASPWWWVGGPAPSAPQRPLTHHDRWWPGATAPGSSSCATPRWRTTRSGMVGRRRRGKQHRKSDQLHAPQKCHFCTSL